MAVEIKVDFPHFPREQEFDVGGVLIQNGKTVKLDDEAELDFVSRHKQAVKDWAGTSEFVTVTGTAKYGPSEVEKMFPEPEPPQVLEADEPTPALVGVPDPNEGSGT